MWFEAGVPEGTRVMVSLSVGIEYALALRDLRTGVQYIETSITGQPGHEVENNT